MKSRIGFGILWLGPLAILGLAQTEDRVEFIRTDPTKVVLPEACGECHRSEFFVWEKTPHATGYDSLHRKESALKIAERMGFHLVKRESLCLKCHFTSVLRREQLRAAGGVSCESCHGAAQDWMNVHNFYGVRESDFQKARTLETPAHKIERQKLSKAAGMLPPSDLYSVAANCYQCHTVPHEELVNRGRHSTGSSDFELVDWIEKIRHNFLESFLTSDGTENVERPPQRKRIMYVVGRALDLEYSIRGIAVAKQRGRYVKAMIRRSKSALSELREVFSRSSLTEVGEMVEAVRGVKLKASNEEALLETANRIASATKRFLRTNDGTELASLDALYSGTGDEVADRLGERPAEQPPPGDDVPIESSTATVSPHTAEDIAAEVSSSDESDRAPTVVSSAKSSPDPRKRVRTPPRKRKRVSDVGRIRRCPPWRPTPTHKAVGPDKCGSCHRHSDQDEWWLDDKHYESADPLLAGEKKYLQIARFYGLGPSEMRKGNQICMQCHGSIVSGRESRDVDLGVGCESCHGPGADFREPHQEKGNYEKALKLGMVRLRDLETRAKTCAGCHYITEPRLISAGHPTGSDFDFSERNSEIQHWEHPLATPTKLKAAYQNVVADRGAIPSVPVYREPAHSEGSPVVAASGQAADEAEASPNQSLGIEVPTEATRVRRTPATRAAARPSKAAGRPRPQHRSVLQNALVRTGKYLQTFPSIDEKATVEEILLLLKERLELLYAR